MKKVLLLTAAVLISGSAMAQHEHFHVFRNDKQFNTFNNVQEITYQGSPSSGYDKMLVTDAKGNTTTIDIEAIDSVVIRSTGIPEFHVNLTPSGRNLPAARVTNIRPYCAWTGTECTTTCPNKKLYFAVEVTPRGI